MNPEELKLIVREKYGEIASQNKNQNQSSCCGSSGCCYDMDYSIFSDDYTQLEGYNADADLGLGCGIPTEYAAIKKEKEIIVPNSILLNYITLDELRTFKKNRTGIYSITMTAVK